VKVDRKNNEIINRLEKTQLELSPDFKAEQDVYLAHMRASKRVEEKARRAEEKAAKEENRRLKELREYKHIMKVCEASRLALFHWTINLCIHS